MALRQSEQGSCVARKMQSLGSGRALARPLVELLERVHLAVPERILGLVVGLGDDERQVAFQEDRRAEKLVALSQRRGGSAGTMSLSMTSSRRETSVGRVGHASIRKGSGKVKIVGIGVVAAPVDDDEIGDSVERGQDAVPGARRVVDALSRRGEEGARRARPVAVIGSDDDEEAGRAHRNEGLRAVGDGARPWLRSSGRTKGVARAIDKATRGIGAARRGGREVVKRRVVPPLIGWLARAASISMHVAEGREGGGGQRLDRIVVISTASAGG